VSVREKECAVIGSCQCKLGDRFTTHDPVRRGCDQLQRTEFRRNEVGGETRGVAMQVKQSGVDSMGRVWGGMSPPKSGVRGWGYNLKLISTLYSDSIPETPSANKNNPERGLRSSPDLDSDLGGSDDLESHIVVNVSSTSIIILSFIKIGRSRFLANFEVT